MSIGELDRRGLTEQPKDPFRFVKYAGWAVGIVMCFWAMAYCGVYVDGTPSDNPPNFQEGEFDDDYGTDKDKGPLSRP